MRCLFISKVISQYSLHRLMLIKLTDDVSFYFAEFSNSGCMVKEIRNASGFVCILHTYINTHICKYKSTHACIMYFYMHAYSKILDAHLLLQTHNVNHNQIQKSRRCPHFIYIIHWSWIMGHKNFFFFSKQSSIWCETTRIDPKDATRRRGKQNQDSA